MLVSKKISLKNEDSTWCKRNGIALRHVTFFQYLNNSSPGPWECWTNSEVIFPGKSGALILLFPCFLLDESVCIPSGNEAFVPFMYILYIPWEFHTRFNGHSCCPKTGWFHGFQTTFPMWNLWASIEPVSCWTGVRFRIPSQRYSFQTWWNDPKPAIAWKLMGKPLGNWWVSRFFLCFVSVRTYHKCCWSCLSVKFVQISLFRWERTWVVVHVYLSIFPGFCFNSGEKNVGMQRFFHDFAEWIQAYRQRCMCQCQATWTSTWLDFHARSFESLLVAPVVDMWIHSSWCW